jgi:acylphosphatase
MHSVQTRQVHYEGHVQGVGFRYTTLQVAKAFAVTGTVQNLPDGRVLLVAQGEAQELSAFLEAVHERLKPHIRGVHAQVLPDAKPMTGFVLLR